MKAIASVRSVGASTRIEGSNISDAEVKVLIEKLAISKLEDHDSQEVAGYFEALNLLSEAYPDMDISERTIFPTGWCHHPPALTKCRLVINH